MATGILMPGAVVANPVDIIPPTIANLVLWTYFGGSLAQCVNAGSGGALAAGAGSGVTYAAHYASCHGIVGSLALPSVAYQTVETWMGVVRYTGGGTSGAAGTLFNPATTGATISITSTTLNFQAAGITATNLTIAANGGNNFKFYAYTGAVGGPHTFYNLTDATQQLISATGTLPTASQATGIGGPSTVSGANDRGTDSAFQAMAFTTLTKPQIDAQYAAVKNVLAQYGINV